MQTDNDYDKEVFNGDVGYVRHIDPNLKEMVIEFDGRPVEYQFGELDEVALAYAVSIHKSQGSEYPAIVRKPMRRAVRAMRQAISPRLAIRRVLNIRRTHSCQHSGLPPGRRALAKEGGDAFAPLLGFPGVGQLVGGVDHVGG